MFKKRGQGGGSSEPPLDPPLNISILTTFLYSLCIFLYSCESSTLGSKTGKKDDVEIQFFKRNPKFEQTLFSKINVSVI